MRVKPATRAALRLVALGFAIGVAFQVGLGLASSITPRVTEIHITAPGLGGQASQ